MKRIVGFIAICILLLGVSIQARDPQGAPKPGPEVQKLAYFVGNWKEAGKSTAHGMEGPVTSTQKWEWMAGGFFLCGTFETINLRWASFKMTTIVGYDPATKMYTYNVFDSWGESFLAKGTVSGDTWTWTTEMPMGTKTMKARTTWKVISPTKYTLNYGSSTDGGKTWSSDMETTFTKVMGAAAPVKK